MHKKMIFVVLFSGFVLWAMTALAEHNVRRANAMPGSFEASWMIKQRVNDHEGNYFGEISDLINSSPIMPGKIIQWEVLSISGHY